MKSIKLLLCLLIILPNYIYAVPQGRSKDIKLQKCLSSTPVKKKRSVDFWDVSAHINDEVLLINVHYCKIIQISVINFLTNETVYSGLHSASNDIVLNMNGLLEEGSDYRLEIIIGETILYGEFNI